MSIERQRDQWPHRTAAMTDRPDDAYGMPEGYRTPRWRNHLERPQMPGGAFHFSPTEVNPKSTSPARPETFEHYYMPNGNPALDLGKDLTGHPLGDRSTSYAVERAPQELYRGVRLHTDDSEHRYTPALARMRRLLYGPSEETDEDWGHEGNGHYNERLPGMPTNAETAAGPHPLGYDHPELPHLLLQHLNETQSPELGYYGDSLGRHWSTSQGQASLYARLVPGQSLGHVNHDLISAVLAGRWKGQGEDPYRRFTMGDFPDEQEVTLLPGAPLNIHRVHFFNPNTREWHVHNLNGGEGMPHHASREDDWYEDEPVDPAPVGHTTPRWNITDRPQFGDGSYYFSPHEVNPRSDSYARPSTTQYFTHSDDPALPLPHESVERNDQGEHKAKDQLPHELYRGVNLDLTDHDDRTPHMDRIRRLLYGDALESLNPPGLPGMPHDYRAATKPHPLGYDHPDLPELLLSHLAEGHRGLGTHWSTDPEMARRFAGVKPHQSVFNTGGLRAVLAGHWKGQGEDPYRTQTDGDYPEEKEITLLPQAPLNIHQVHLFNPNTLQWHTHDLGGTQRHARREDEDYRPGPVGLRSPLFRSNERPTFYNSREDTYQHHFLPHDHNPASDAESRPYLEFPKDGDHYDRPTLDLKLPPSEWSNYDRDLPPGHGNGVDHIPTGSSGAELYRGINLDMRVPELAALRRAIYGPEKESYYRGTPNSHFTDKKKFQPAQPYQPGMFPGIFSDKELAAPPADPDRLHEHLPALLNYLAGWHPKQGIGKHWSTDFDQATDFASPHSIYNDEYAMLPVRLTGRWKGRGEDPYRRDVGETYPGEYGFESELNLLPGAPVDLTNVEYFHPKTKQWHSMMDGDPQRIHAGKGKKPPQPKKMWFATEQGLHHSLEDTFAQSSPKQLYQLLRTDNTFAQKYMDHLNQTHNRPPEEDGREFIGSLARDYPDVLDLLGDL